ncbi:E3 ubiquitin-protein ligase rnf152 [Xyrichtys novacula]|uniref:E3 ubiquitin-protein ligase rnf152 n=1 Tax=Xyrichtys novacula TaxID=13765 RepID=A0AAV1GAD7_XYRNO|nr:E3 ubiquitin-protein ligase rnf152 [Xyrichtys novacula]
MNAYRETILDSHSKSQPSSSLPDPHSSHDLSAEVTLPPSGVIQIDQNSVSELSSDPAFSVAPATDGGQNVVQNSVHSDSSPPVLQPSLPANSSPLNPYPAPATPPSYQVSVIIPSPDLCPSPLQPQHADDSCPDLECSICFSQFNNIFRCPKMLQCKHTFCLECLARINVKSAQPSAIQCPLCRSFTPLPDLGLPKLATDSDVLSYLPAAMQRVYSIRFLRNKGKLQVKRSTDGHRQQGHRSLTSLRSANRTLDVGLPSPPAGVSASSESGGCGEALFRLTGQPVCRAFLLTSVVMMAVLLTGIVIFLLTFNKHSG